jgi:hypothetical protein
LAPIDVQEDWKEIKKVKGIKKRKTNNNHKTQRNLI